jgi:hypothetical protein
MDIFGRFKSYLDAITDRSAAQEIPHNPQVRNWMQEVSDLRNSLRVADVVLRQGA